MWKKLISYLLVFTATWSVHLLPAAASQSAATGVKESADAVDVSGYLKLIAELRSHIDRSQFDLKVLLEELDFEAGKIIEFVGAEIAFEQYPGLLRGARGTLTSRAGNALDQAVLLATLLKDAGYEARIHRGRLSKDQAVALLGQMRPASAYPPAADFEAIMKRLGNQRRPPRPEEQQREESSWKPPEVEAIERAVRSLGSTLEKEGIELGDPQSWHRLLEEARDYFWVQARTDTAEWIAVHPALTDMKQFGGIDTTEIFANEIPPGLQHRIRFQVFIEQKVGDELKVHPTMDPWERPVANAAGHSFAFVNVPWGLDEESLKGGWPWEAALEKAELFLPVFGDGIAPGARAFDRDGALFDVDLLGLDGMGATALIREVAGKFESAAGALGGAASQASGLAAEDLMALTAQWIQYTVITPGGEETTYRREILDRLGPAARKRGDLTNLSSPLEYRRLLSRHVFHLAVGRTPPALLLDELLAERGRLAASIESSLKADPAQDGRPPVFAVPELFLFSIFERMENGPDRLLYRSGPALVTRQTGLEPEGDRRRFLGDIVRSPWRAFRWEEDSQPLASPSLVMKQGVWETATEDYLATLVHAPEVAVESTFAGKRTQPVALKAGTEPGSTVADLGADAETLLREDLGAGWVAVVNTNEELQQLNRDVAWWRIAPGSGETLGIGIDGRGPVTVEWMIKATAVAVGVAGVLQCAATACEQWYRCKAAPDPRCCMVRFMTDRRREYQESFPASLLYSYNDAVYALAGMDGPYDATCLYEHGER